MWSPTRNEYVSETLGMTWDDLDKFYWTPANETKGNTGWIGKPSCDAKPTYSYCQKRVWTRRNAKRMDTSAD